MARKYKLTRKALKEMLLLRKPPPQDPDPIPFTRVRFFNNSGENVWATARGVDDTGGVAFDWTNLNAGFNIPPGPTADGLEDGYEGLDDGIDFSNVQDVVEIQMWILFESKGSWEYWSETASQPMHGILIDAYFPRDQFGFGTVMNCFRHIT